MTQPTTTANDGTVDVTKREEKTVNAEDLNGSAIVVVKKAGGEVVEMTYSEYLEAKKADPKTELLGVYEDTIEPPDDGDDDNNGGGNNDEGDDEDDGEDDIQIPVLPPQYNPPVQNNQDVEEPVIEIEAPEVPLAAGPEEEEPAIEIEEPEVPLTDAPEEEEAVVEIADVEVPLADVPHTGDESAIWTLMALLSMGGMICMMAIERKKREEN